MAFLTTMDITGSALTAERFRINIISQNLTNMETTRTKSGEPYRRKQVVFQEREMPKLPGDLEVLNVSQVGRITTLIVRGRAHEITNRLSVYCPILLEALPLTLEEIFIYELGGEDYEVRDVIL